MAIWKKYSKKYEPQLLASIRQAAVALFILRVSSSDKVEFSPKGF